MYLRPRDFLTPDSKSEPDPARLRVEPHTEESKALAK